MALCSHLCLTPGLIQVIVPELTGAWKVPSPLVVETLGAGRFAAQQFGVLGCGQCFHCYTLKERFPLCPAWAAANRGLEGAIVPGILK